MVNYCCVYGCGRNSRSHGYLTFYTLPKEKARLEQWLKAACPEAVGTNLNSKSLRNRRFCSRHFAPSSIRNQRLLPNAVPTLCLTGSHSDEEIACPQRHPGLVCDGCGGPIVGFRYKCTECKDFDLCQRCETHETHGDHAMLRLPRPLDFEAAQNLTNKWSGNLTDLKKAKVKNDVVSIECDSSDDEPITKYRKRNSHQSDCEWSLPEEVKTNIRREVMRAIKASKIIDIKKTVTNKAVIKPKKVTKTSKAGGVQEKPVKHVEIEPAEYFTPKVGLLEVPIEFASVDSERSHTVESQEDAKPIMEAAEIRQSAMDIAMNDTLSEFLIKKI